MFYQNSIKELLEQKLNENTHGILFKAVLFNYKSQEEYFNFVDDAIHDFVKNKRYYIPCIIPSFNGEYLGIPNKNASNNNVSMQYLIQTDEFGGDTLEYSTNDYEKVFNAIDEVRQELIGSYNPLGTKAIVTAEDSSAVFNTTGVFSLKTVYYKGKMKDGLAGNILNISSLLGGTLSKFSSTLLNFSTDTSEIATVPYTVGQRFELYIHYANPLLNLTINNLDDDDVVLSTSTVSVNLGQVQDTKIEDLILYSFYGETEMIAISSVENDTIENMLLGSAQLLFKDFDNDETISSLGSITGDLSLTNCFHKGLDGNIVITGKPILPTSRLITRNGYDFMEFDLQLDISYSEDLKYGNQWKYKLDGYDIIPVDRPLGKTFATQGLQYLNTDTSVNLTDNNVFSTSLSFYSEDSIIGNKLEKIAINANYAQNTTFQLYIKQPLYSTTKTVIVESINITPTLNGFSAYTVTFKEADTEVI